MDFADLLCEECAVLAGFHPDRRAPEALSSLDYRVETRVKSAAAAKFCAEYKAVLRPLLSAPLPRNYRSTTKRRAVFASGRLLLKLGDARASALDPAPHAALYAFLETELSQPKYRDLARELHFAIVRGAGERLALILNTRRISGDIVRKLKLLADTLNRECPEVEAFYSYLDESESDYYFERERPKKKVALKKLFGPAKRAVKPLDMKLLYPLTSFSQINEAMLPQLIETALSFLPLAPTTRVIDLYCGYGLFGLHALRKAQSLIGLDYAGEAVDCAAANAAKLFPGRSLKFFGSPVTADALKALLPPPATDEVVILDPPRTGCYPGVIETVCSRRPRAALQICCGADTLKKELKIWTNNGYEVQALQMLDLFPGTLGVESLAMLTPRKK